MDAQKTKWIFTALPAPGTLELERPIGVHHSLRSSSNDLCPTSKAVQAAYAPALTATQVKSQAS
ncbi:MAG TPA: hypothetical protein VGE52_16205, partial [Pirellulales bacterium]